MLRRALILLIVVPVTLGACGPVDERAEASPDTPARVAVTADTAPSTSIGRAMGTTQLEPDPEWVVGAHPLPLRADGLGEILPTPEVLIDRQLRTASDLAPPAGDGFESSVSLLDDEVAERMGDTWQPGCPVPLADLRYVTVSFWGFDGGHHTGELIVHRDVAEDVVWVFEQIHEERFPIEEMRLITTADLEAPATGDGNNTASFVCRSIRGGSSWSEHARGLAVDINPFHNPYERGDVVLPELASTYLDRGRSRPGMVQPGDVVTESFSAIGWSWGGDWSSPDYMHFSSTGR